MKQLINFLSASAVCLCLSAVPVLAQHGGGHGSGGGTGQGVGMGGQGGGTGPGSTHDRGGSDMTRGGKMSGPNQGRNNPEMRSGKTPGELLTQNTKLSSNLQSLLPEGTNLQQAADGFKNLGQFVAAAHVSKNLGIPFDDLKTKMIGGDSLGKAIHELKPDANAKAEAKKAKKQAKQDLNEPGS